MQNAAKGRAAHRGIRARFTAILARGTGILNNELYVGRLVWNRQRFIKDPDTGKRVSRPNPESEWVIHDVPELRIIDDDLWRRVKERQRALAYKPGERGANPLLDRR